MTFGVVAKLRFHCILDTSLTFDHHVSATVASYMSWQGQINRVKHCFDNRTLIIIINAFVFSRKVLHNLTLLNFKLFRILPVQSLMDQRNTIMSLPFLDNWTGSLWNNMYYRESIMAFKCMNGLAPGYLSDQFVKHSSISTRKTRNSQLLNIPLFKIATGPRTFYYRMVSLWNTLPQG